MARAAPTNECAPRVHWVTPVPSGIVYPLIEESEEIDARSAEEGFQELVAGPLRGLRVALVTGRTPSEERERIMAGFRTGELQVLVGTTVLEVGVDVPRASVMVVESAQRFGLSTLHQPRVIVHSP